MSTLNPFPTKFLKKLPKALPIDFSLRIGIWFSLLVVGTLLIRHGNIFAAIFGLILNGLMFVHGVELQHQCLHNTAFKNKASNRFWGRVLGVPMIVSFTAYQESHLWHHRFLGTARDKEFFDYDRSEQMTGASLLNYCLVPRRYVRLFKEVAKLAGILRKGNDSSRAAGVETVLLFVAIGLLASVSVYVGSTLIVYAWLPALVIAEPVHNLIELPEHIGCETNSRLVVKNTRTIRTTALMNWFTNSNNFHVEHHMVPGVPMQLMSRLHQDIAPQIKFLDDGYSRFFSKLLSAQTSRANRGIRRGIKRGIS